jgi:hypothetical protein
MSIQKLFGAKIGIIVPTEKLVLDYKQIMGRLQFVSLLDIQIGVPNDF